MPAIDFNRLRREIPMQDVLDLLGFQPTSRRGDQLHGPCPVHKSTSPGARTFSANLGSGRYYCHKCRSRGNQLELWGAVRGLMIYDASLDLCHALGREVPWLITGRQRRGTGNPPPDQRTPIEYRAIRHSNDRAHAHPDGSGPLWAPTTYYNYDNAGRLKTVDDPLCRVTTYAYNNRDWVTSQTAPDPDGAGSLSAPVTTRAYDAAGRQTSVTDPLSRVTSFGYDHEGRRTSVTLPDPDGGGPLSAPVSSWVYNALGTNTSSTDPRGNVTSYAYDNLQRLTSTTHPDPDGAGPLSAPVSTVVYNSQGVQSKVTDPLGRDTSYGYDGLGRRNSVKDHLNNQTTFTYDSAHRLLTVTAPDPDGAGSLTAPVTNYAYDDLNRLTSILDPLNGATTSTYDAAGRTLTLVDPEDNTTSWAYDNLGRLTIETNELGDTRSFTYDVVNQLARRVDRNGRVIQYDRDALDRVTAEKWYQDGTATPSIAIATTTEGGPVNEVQRVGFSATGAVTGGTFTLSFNGATTAAIAYDATAAQVKSALEALSTVGTGNVSVTKTQSSTTSQEWQVTFQGSKAATNVVQITVNASNITYSGSLTNIQLTDIQGVSSANEVQTVTLSNANGGTFRLAFNGQTTAPISQSATAATIDSSLEALNSVDLVTVTGNAGGPWTVTFAGTHTNVNVAQMNADASSLTSGTLSRTLSFTYDAANQTTAASDPDSTYAYTYDNIGRVLTVDNNGTSGVPRVILTSAFDAASNRTSLSASVNSTADFLNSYTYDNLNRPTRIDQAGQAGGNSVAEKRVDLSYNALGLFTQIARYKDTDGGSTHEVATSTYTYDTLGRLTGLAYKKGGTNLFTPYAWTFDSLSQVGSAHNLPGVGVDPRLGGPITQSAVPSANAGRSNGFQSLGRITQVTSQDGTTTFTHDATSQLTGADHSYQADESYSYDANGNRTMSGYQTGSNNRLLNDGTYEYEYDDEGNRTRRTKSSDDSYVEYAWDFRNRLTKVTERNASGTILEVVEYKYDVFDRRIARAVDITSPFDLQDAAIERYVLDDARGVASGDGGNVVLDFVDPDGSGSTAIALAKRYLYGPAVDQLFAQEDLTKSISATDRVLWPLVDNLQTVRDLAKNDGAIAVHYKYDSFGKVTSGDTSLTRYLFTTRDFDVATGLQYNRARWYDFSAGRWTSEDPMSFAALDPNVSRYVMNGPLYSVDPSGLDVAGALDAVEETVSVCPQCMLYAALSGGSPMTYMALRALEQSIRDAVAVHSNVTRAGSTGLGAMVITVGFAAADYTGVRGVSDAFSEHDAVDAHVQPWYEQVTDGVTGAVSLVLTAVSIGGVKRMLTPGGPNCFVAGTLVHMDAGTTDKGEVTFEAAENDLLTWGLFATCILIGAAGSLRWPSKRQHLSAHQQVFTSISCGELLY